MYSKNSSVYASTSCPFAISILQDEIKIGGQKCYSKLAKFFTSGFVYPNITLTGLALGIGLGIAFGAIWLIGYRPPIFKKPWLWAVVAASSAVLTWAAVVFLQTSLQAWSIQALGHFWGQQTLMRWLLVASIPSILLSGLVQEGSKLVPVVIWWHRKNRNITAKTGLIIGAIAGAGFGVFEAVWVLNTTFALWLELENGRKPGFSGATAILRKVFRRSVPHWLLCTGRIRSSQRLGMAILPGRSFLAWPGELQRTFCSKRKS